ncbi:hypothetical protein FB157_108140 [Streptomyces sp. BK340]|nr:hypothetical protein FB157_108140 [Streptomyces sp. BK340]
MSWAATVPSVAAAAISRLIMAPCNFCVGFAGCPGSPAIPHGAVRIRVARAMMIVTTVGGSVVERRGHGISELIQDVP